MTVAKVAAGGDWFRVFARQPSARLRLFCFPHAGGGASAFHALSALAPDSVEVVAVQYPGRQDRYGEPMPRAMGQLVADLTDAVAGCLDRPAAFFGHSMGATVAFEVARRLRTTHPASLVRLFASARRAPHVDTSRTLDFHDDEAAMAYIRSLGGVGAQLLDEPELRELALPVLRADFQLIADYRFTPGAPLTCPITVIAGDQDRSFTLQDAREWARHTVAGYDAHALPGGHFYLETEVPGLVLLLMNHLTRDVPSLETAAVTGSHR
ncbi:alpha/beta fold hydrolase [Streptomyces sp. MD20-1-1]|uniref:thioesterase II family protein n=1 Tax=Streptomyces sp. MD20-1-1 TaxID=3028668 RepID=UPI0029BCDB4B|nr:alpha/beta fold hydrolase [Streptomyces sp. MD20-1-1]WTC15594.1 alpha/beta fold hydrolase [Streptomyces cellulosae]